ncbi:hypothetical protein ACE939_12830 [Aquimarina sp. W85]|uniref:hypothetical protein n=1 Tax=Aquimarina rhodophyticola TaxID=3342246 RepID=UPI00366ECB6A
MRTVIYCCFLMCLWACKSQEVSKEIKQPVDTKSMPQKPKYRGEALIIDPNTILIRASNVKLSSDKTSLCGKTYDKSITVKIEQLQNIGSSLVNTPAKGQVLMLGLSNILLKQYELKISNKSSDLLSIKLKERLCPDMTMTRFEVISFE